MTIVVSDAPRGWTGPEIEAPQGASGSEEVFTFVEAALSGDQAAEVDRLGVAPLADGLARLIMLPQTRPLTVGVQAPWGWGKSSFVAFVREALVRHAPTNLLPTPELDQLEALDALLGGAVDQEEQGSDAEIAAKRRTAGRGAPPAAAGARAPRAPGRHLRVLQRLALRGLRAGVGRAGARDHRRDGGDAQRPRAAVVARSSTRTAAASSSSGSASWPRSCWPLLVAGLAIALGVADAGDELSGWTGGIAAVLAPAVAVVLVAWRFLHVIQPVSVQVAGYVQGPDYAAHMGYQNEVIDDLKFLHERVDGEPRVVVCVDDLDRCSDESIMETLQAINLVLGASDFFVVLAIDPDMIYRAIARQRGISDDDDAAEVFAENYLRKIIQLPLVLPGRSADQRFGFVSQLFSPTAQREFRRSRGGARPPGRRAAARGRARRRSPSTRRTSSPRACGSMREVQDTKEELEALEASRHLLHDNPRELKRLVNVHRLVKILLQRPEAPPTAAEQRKLMAWLVFCAASPGQVDDLLEQATTGPDEAELVTIGDERLTAHDLAPDGALARAARISLLVRDRPAPTRPPTSAESGPAAPPAASPS